MTEETKEEVYYTYGMIKPDGMENREEIIRIILNSGLKVDYFKCDMLTDDLIEENYGHVKKKYPEDFKLLKESLKSGPVLMMLIYDPKGDAVKKYRKVLGVTNSWEAEPDTIRGRFGDKEKVYKNAAHGSGNAKEANEEIFRFFKNDLTEIIYHINSARRKEFINGPEGRNLASKPRCTYTDAYFINSTLQLAQNAHQAYIKKESV